MKIRFLTIAQIELYEAVDYYNAQAPGLGDEFLVEVLKTLERIKSFPKAWHLFTKNTRRCQLQRFSYGIIYLIMKTEIRIIAVSHLHRKPGYWSERVSPSA